VGREGLPQRPRSRVRMLDGLRYRRVNVTSVRSANRSATPVRGRTESRCECAPRRCGKGGAGWSGRIQAAPCGRLPARAPHPGPAAGGHRAARPVLCVAPAGSGKTTTLVARIAWLIDGGVDPATVAAITFNKRAAEEAGRADRRGPRAAWRGPRDRADPDVPCPGPRAAAGRRRGGRSAAGPRGGTPGALAGHHAIRRWGCSIPPSRSSSSSMP
jgi:hypothetical protein